LITVVDQFDGFDPFPNRIDVNLYLPRPSIGPAQMFFILDHLTPVAHHFCTKTHTPQKKKHMHPLVNPSNLHQNFALI
jgi:hypothetical protein